MKLLQFAILFFFVLNFNATNAQISEEQKSMTLGVKNALVLEIPDAEAKLIEKWWKKFMSEYDGKTKKVKKSDEWMTEGADIPGISKGKSLTIYSRTEDYRNSTSQVVWFGIGSDYVSSASHRDAYVECQKVMMRFGLFITKEMIKMELADEEKEMKSLQGELKKLKNQNESYHKQIEKAKEQIKKAEEAIAKNEIEQETKLGEIKEQTSVVDEVKGRLNEIN